jgi:hypothetical protein
MEVQMPRLLNWVGTHRLRQPWLKSSASICESRDEQTELLCLLMMNSNHDGTVVGNA